MFYIEEKFIKLKELFKQNAFFRYLIIIGCAAAIFCSFYYGGKEVFQVYNGISETSIRLQGSNILYGGNGATHGVGKWVFEQGASGTFQTADGKTVTVSGGLITSIS